MLNAFEIAINKNDLLKAVSFMTTCLSEWHINETLYNIINELWYKLGLWNKVMYF